MTSEDRTYGETALMTPANMMTAFRIVIAPVFIYMIIVDRISWWTSAVGFLAAASDYFHGLKSFIIPAVLITLREIWMSVYRSKASKRGISIPASRLAKWKTFVQDWAIAFCVLPICAHHTWIGVTTIWIAVAMTLYTGLKYYVDGKKVVVRAS